MSGDVRPTKNPNSQELQSLYEDYKQKKKQIQDKNQSELNELKKKGQQDLAAERESSQASINHIRRENIKAKESLKLETDKKIAYEKERAQNTISQQQENLGVTIKKREEMSMAHNEQLKADYQQHLSQKNKIRDAQNKDLTLTTEENAKRLERERLEHQAKYQDLRKRGMDTYNQEKMRQDEKVGEIRAESKTTIESERIKGIVNLDETKKAYAEKIQTAHKDGDKNLAQQKEINEKQLHLAREAHKNERKELLKEQQRLHEESHKLFLSQKERNQEIYKKGLAQQSEEFQKTFKRNAELQDKVFTDSNTRLIEEIHQKKLSTLQKAGKYLDASQDPFYNMQKLDTKLTETDSHYVLEAPVPEYEKDQVRVSVRNGKLIVQGQRRFEDKVDGEGQKLSTNTYQTFREELALSRPVAEKLMESSWSDGHLRVRIPKV